MNKTFRKAMVFTPMLLATICAHAQVGRQVSGTIVDADGIPIIGANIVEKSNPTNGTITDFDGNFTFHLSTADAALLFSYMGYVSQEVRVDDQHQFKIILQEDSEQLDEVVVVGYGVQKKKLVTGATSQVNGDDLNKMSSNGVLGAMQSKVSGVTISNGSGMPGTDQKVVIRGLGTIGNAEPLYVIDGVAGGTLSMLNPSDIESVDILKDAASAAIYGSRAANGVVLITTKRGTKDRYEVRYDGYYAIQNPVKTIQSLNARDFMTIQDERRMQAEGTTYDWENLLPAPLYSSIMDGTWQGTNWMEEMTNDNAPMQNHAVTIAGGTDRSKFTASYGYKAVEGIFGKPVQPEVTMHNARMNMDHVMFRKGKLDVLKVGTNLIYMYKENNGIAIGDRFNNDIQNAMSAPSILPAYDQEGDFYDAEDAAQDGWEFDKFAYNPLGMMAENNINKTKQHRLFANAYAELQPIKGLKLRSAFGYKHNSSTVREFTPVYNYSEGDIQGNEVVTQTMQTQFAWTWENTLNYTFKLAQAHDFDVVLGQSMEKSGIGERLSATNSNLSFLQDFDYAWLSNTQGVDPSLTHVSGLPYIQDMLASGFGRINYNFNETYMLSAMMRADGSSNFAPGKRWGYFPSVSAGWVMTNEGFMQSTQGVLDFLKLRLSWGQNGNCNVSPLQYLATVGYPMNGQYFFSSDKTTVSAGAYATILANPDITWETSEQLDLGIDAHFFHSRLNLVLDLYRKDTKDWLVRAPILSSYGTGAPYINGGDIRNQGIELGFNWRDRVGDFNYSIGLNGSYNKNEVTRIANNEGIINGKIDAFDQNTDVLYRAEVGMPIGYFYGYKTEGIFQNEAQVEATPAKVEGAAPGDIIFSDLDGDGKISQADRTMIGNPHPDFIAGLNISLGYKGFDLSVVANGAFGQQVIQSYRPMTNKFYSNFPQIWVDKRWHGEGTSNEFPRLGNTANFSKISDVFVQDADYVKIQNITLGYDVNHAWKKSPFKQLRIYASLQNWFTITGYDGFDPAVGYGGPDGWSSGIDLGFYPTAKSCVFGANIIF